MVQFKRVSSYLDRLHVILKCASSLSVDNTLGWIHQKTHVTLIHIRLAMFCASEQKWMESWMIGLFSVTLAVSIVEQTQFS